MCAYQFNSVYIYIGNHTRGRPVNNTPYKTYYIVLTIIVIIHVAMVHVKG